MLYQGHGLENRSVVADLVGKSCRVQSALVGETVCPRYNAPYYNADLVIMQSILAPKMFPFSLYGVQVLLHL